MEITILTSPSMLGHNDPPGSYLARGGHSVGGNWPFPALPPCTKTEAQRAEWDNSWPSSFSHVPTLSEPLRYLPEHLQCPGVTVLKAPPESLAQHRLPGLGEGRSPRLRKAQHLPLREQTGTRSTNPCPKEELRAVGTLRLSLVAMHLTLLFLGHFQPGT